MTKKDPFVSHYDRSVFYTNIFSASDKPCKPVHNRVKYTIKLTVTLKDIGLEGLDSPVPDETSRIKQREHQKRQGSASPSRSKSSNKNPKPIGLLSTQKSQKRQTVKPKASPRGSPR